MATIQFGYELPVSGAKSITSMLLWTCCTACRSLQLVYNKSKKQVEFGLNRHPAADDGDVKYTR